MFDQRKHGKRGWTNIRPTETLKDVKVLKGLSDLKIIAIVYTVPLAQRDKCALWEVAENYVLSPEDIILWYRCCNITLPSLHQDRISHSCWKKSCRWKSTEVCNFTNMYQTIHRLVWNTDMSVYRPMIDAIQPTRNNADSMLAQHISWPIMGRSHFWGQTSKKLSNHHGQHHWGCQPACVDVN